MFKFESADLFYVNQSAPDITGQLRNLDEAPIRQGSAIIDAYNNSIHLQYSNFELLIGERFYT